MEGVITAYDFDWDRKKASQNRTKHRVSFEEAATVFLDPLALSIPDREHGETEERWITMGKSADGTLLIVVHTFNEMEASRVQVRIISARRATRREQRQYQEAHR